MPAQAEPVENFLRLRFHRPTVDYRSFDSFVPGICPSPHVLGESHQLRCAACSCLLLEDNEK